MHMHMICIGMYMYIYMYVYIYMYMAMRIYVYVYESQQDLCTDFGFQTLTFFKKMVPFLVLKKVPFFKLC